MNAEDLGAARPRSLIPTLISAAVVAFGGAALRRWRLRRLKYADAVSADALAADDVPALLAEHARAKRYERQGVVIGSFHDEGDALRAIETIRRDWPSGFEAYSPQLNEHFLEAMELPKSPTRFWILAGAIFGQFCGWTVTIMLSIYWPHRVGNMPVIAIPPFTILSFELMVLMAAFGGVFGLLYHAGMPQFEDFPEHMRRFTRDRIGIAMNCFGEFQFSQAESILRNLGAEDIVRA